MFTPYTQIIYSFHLFIYLLLMKIIKADYTDLKQLCFVGNVLTRIIYMSKDNLLFKSFHDQIANVSNSSYKMVDYLIRYLRLGHNTSFFHFNWVRRDNFIFLLSIGAGKTVSYIKPVFRKRFFSHRATFSIRRHQPCWLYLT